MVEVRISRKLSPYAYVSTHVSQQVCFFKSLCKVIVKAEIIQLPVTTRQTAILGFLDTWATL